MEKKMPLKSLIVAFALSCAACNPTVKVEAPDKPIVVNLNVKIKHKIHKDLEKVMKSNDDIF